MVSTNCIFISIMSRNPRIDNQEVTLYYLYRYVLFKIKYYERFNIFCIGKIILKYINHFKNQPGIL